MANFQELLSEHISDWPADVQYDLNRLIHVSPVLTEEDTLAVLALAHRAHVGQDESLVGPIDQE